MVPGPVSVASRSKNIRQCAWPVSSEISADKCNWRVVSLRSLRRLNYARIERAVVFLAITIILWRGTTQATSRPVDVEVGRLVAQKDADLAECLRQVCETSESCRVDLERSGKQSRAGLAALTELIRLMREDFKKANARKVD